MRNGSLGQLLGQLGIGTFHYDSRNDLTTWDDTVFDIYGFPTDTVPTIELSMSTIHPEDVHSVLQRFSTRDANHTVRSTHRVIRTDGSVRHVHVQSTMLTDANGDTEIDGIIIDLDSLLGEEATAVAQAQVTAALMDTFRDGVAIIGEDSRLISSNIHWGETLAACGYPADFDLLGSLPHLVDRQLRKRTMDRIAHLRVGRIQETSIELPVMHQGERRFYNVDLRNVGAGSHLFCAVLSDVTERKAQEAELLHSRKLEAVGQLASGIAHEINTPIQFIGDNLRFLHDSTISVLAVLDGYRDQVRRLAHGELDLSEIEAALDEIDESADVAWLRGELPAAATQAMEGADRVATIVRAMKMFGHPGEGQSQQSADINQMLENALIVTRNELKYVATVETDFGHLPPVTCFVGDMNQVLLNVLVNAAHAIADTHQRGTLRVSTCVDGADAVIRIADTGIGMTPEVRDRIFEPFFTTKEVGRGTGQGLAITHAIIVERHQGSIGVESTPGVGTRFEFRIPIDGLPTSRAHAA